MQPKGIGLALDSGTVFDQTLEEIELGWQKDDFFLFFTDGLNEARCVNFEEYGVERVLKILVKSFNKSANEIRKILIDDVAKFTKNAKKHDDLSIIVIKIDK